jgi:hypothetical protein
MKTLKNKLQKNNFCQAIFMLCVLTSCSDSNKENTSFEKENVDSLSKFIVFEDYSFSDSSNISNKGFHDFESYKMRFDTLNIDNTTMYIVEGDLLLDLDELKVQFKRVNKSDQSRKLVIITNNGEPMRIENPKNIRYSIIKQSFSEEEYTTICKYFEDAASDWKRVCNVNFVHVTELDSRLRPIDNPAELTFVVRKIGSSGGLLASAFFPYDSKDERKVLITSGFFRTSFDKTGVLRHEIGHILGFRHEHIRSGAPAECPNESTDFTQDLTLYDPQSVMHYFCGGAGTIDLKITRTDSIGASKIYPFNH